MKTHKAVDSSGKASCGFVFKSLQAVQRASTRKWFSVTCGNCLRFKPVAPSTPHHWYAVKEHRLYICQICGLSSRSRSMHSEFSGLGTQCPGPKPAEDRRK